MSKLIQQALVLLPSRSPLTQFQRFRGKINIQRPKQPHYERAKVLAVTQPVFAEPPKAKTCFQPNPRMQHVYAENPYNDIVAREVHNWLANSRMVAIFHVNSINEDDMFRLRVQLHKQNMHIKSYGKKIIAKAVADTRFEAILPLFESNHCMVFSTETRVGLLLRLTRKTPQMMLIGGIVDDTLLSRNEFIAYGKLPALPLAQAQLVQTLNMAAGNLVQQLELHQNNLVNILDVYAREGGSGATSGTSENSAQPATTLNEEKEAA